MIATIQIKLKPEIISEIRTNQDLKNRLQLEMKISNSTLYRLLNKNSNVLTTATALKIIGQELVKTNEELLTETEA